MERVEKTVFISYRRTNVPWALAVWQDLTQHGYDVFFDYEGIASGDFESVILGNITARAHFLIILTPSTLERCGEPKDMMRREIETAIESKRNIVPLMLEGFSFGTPAIANQLTGTLAPLKDYNGLSMPAEYFLAAMEKLRNKFLNVPLSAVLQPASRVARKAASEQKTATDTKPPAEAVTVAPEEAASEEAAAVAALRHSCFISYSTKDMEFAQRLNVDLRARGLRVWFAPEELKIGDYFQERIEKSILENDKTMIILSEASLQSSWVEREVNAALEREARENRIVLFPIRIDNQIMQAKQPWAADLRRQRQIGDFTNWKDYDSYQQAFARLMRDLEPAPDDYNEAIQHKSEYADAYYNRGLVRKAKGDLEGAIEDLTEAIRRKPDYAEAYNNRGITRQAMGDLDGALDDYNEAIRLKPNLASE